MNRLTAKWTPYTFFALVLVAFATACGGDDDSDDGPDANNVTPGGATTGPTQASTGGSTSTDTGAAAAEGEGRLEVGGKTYPIAITVFIL